MHPQSKLKTSPIFSHDLLLARLFDFEEDVRSSKRSEVYNDMKTSSAITYVWFSEE